MLATVAALVLLDTSRLQVGTNWSGQAEVRYYSRDAEIDETHLFRLRFNVTGKQAGMWLVDRTSELLNTRIEKTDLGPPPNAIPTVTKLWLAPKGFLLDMKPYEKGLFGLDRLIHYWLPENQPDDWTVQLTTADDSDSSKAKAEFSRVKDSSRTLADYSFRYATLDDPKGISAKGRLVFEVRTGRLMKAKIEATNLYPPTGAERTNATIAYTDSTLVGKP
jgi:hypothetical protein